MPRVQTAAAGDQEAGAQGAPGGADMHPSLDLPTVSWSEPPRDILDFILEKIKDHRDTLLFGSVCAAWRSFVLENLKRFPRQLPLARCLPQQCQLPLLMLPCNDGGSKTRDFFCPFEHKFYSGTPLPDRNKWIWGSSNGWLVTADIRADIRGSVIYLFNPITGDQRYLPPHTEIPQPKYEFDTFYYLRKAVLSKSPASNIEECAVMSIISCVGFSCCRPGDRKWTNVTDSPRDVDDIIYYKEQFYAVGMSGEVVACNIGPSPKATAVVGTPKLHNDDELEWKRYLVESRGELLLVVRMMQFYRIETDDPALMGQRTVGFQVFKLLEKGSEDDEDKQNEEYETIDEMLVPVEDSSYKWVKLDNLRDQIIFLGLSESLSLPASALPNSSGNCIYFTDEDIDMYYGILIEGDNPNGREDMGVFNLEDGSIHHYHPKGLVFPMPAIWVSPAPW